MTPKAKKPAKAKKPNKWLTPKQELKAIISFLDDDNLKALRSYARFIHYEQRMIEKSHPKGGE